MQNDPFLTLGLSQDATQSQVEEAYNSLKDIYSEQQFLEGETGAKAARKLAEIDMAYEQCLMQLESKISFDGGGVNSYAGVESLIKRNKLEDAQAMLDEIESRDAEWHYLQAIIYYKKEWRVECKNQLEIALELDSDNAKYKGALDRLNNVQSRGNDQSSNNNQQHNNQNRAGYSRPQNNRGGGNSEACCNTCSTLICCDCCCESCGGDLISCC